MEKHIVDAVRILNAAYDASASTALQFQRDHLINAIRYLSNPDRYMHPKRGPSNVKGGKRRANLAYGKFGVPGGNVK